MTDEIEEEETEETYSSYEFRCNLLNVVRRDIAESKGEHIPKYRKGSMRGFAWEHGISHTQVSQVKKFAHIAYQRGIGEEFMDRVVKKEKLWTIVADMMPDIAHEEKAKRQLAQFKSSARWLLYNGSDIDELESMLEEFNGMAVWMKENPDE